MVWFEENLWLNYEWFVRREVIIPECRKMHCRVHIEVWLLFFFSSMNGLLGVEGSYYIGCNWYEEGYIVVCTLGFGGCSFLLFSFKF